MMFWTRLASNMARQGLQFGQIACDKSALQIHSNVVYFRCDCKSGKSLSTSSPWIQGKGKSLHGVKMIMNPVMRIFLLISTALLWVATGAAITLISTPTNNVTHLSLPGVSDARCYKKGILDRRLAQRTDCAQAALLFPHSTVRGDFYRGGDPRYELFALPHTETFKTCTITVDLRYVPYYERYWLTVSVAMNQLILACTQKSLTGGQIAVGPNEELFIRFQRTGSVTAGSVVNQRRRMIGLEAPGHATFDARG